MKIKIRVEKEYNILFGESIFTGIFIFYDELSNDILLNISFLPDRYITFSRRMKLRTE